MHEVAGVEGRQPVAHYLQQRRKFGDANGGKAGALGRQVRSLPNLSQGSWQLRRQLLPRRQALQQASPLKC